MVLALLGFMQPLRTWGKAECGAESLWGSSVPDPISLRQFLPMSCNGPKPMCRSYTGPQFSNNYFWPQHSFFSWCHMPGVSLWIPLCSRVCNTLWQLPVAPSSCFTGQGAQPGTWVMSVHGNTLLRMSPQGAHPAGAKSPLGPGKWTCYVPGGAAPEWCLSTELHTEVWELWVSSPFLLPEKLKRSGARQIRNLSALLLSQALYLDRPSVPATVPLPTASHPAHGKQLQGTTCALDLQEGKALMARAWMWARAAPQLLMGAGVGAAAASCLLTHPHEHWCGEEGYSWFHYLVKPLWNCLCAALLETQTNLWVHWRKNPTGMLLPEYSTGNTHRQGAICNGL